MPVRALPSNPNLVHLKYQAKDLLKAHAARDPRAAQRLREFHPRFLRATDDEIFASGISLSDAQLAIAREYGFPSWARLKHHIEKPTLPDQLNLPHHQRIEDGTFRRAVDLIDSGDTTALRAHLKQHPQLVQSRITFEGGNYFRNPTLLEFIAENPVRHGTLPRNIVEVARVILDSGVELAARNETLMLVATGSVPRECRLQLPLIDLLCEYGAQPDSALRAAALHGELQSVHALLQHGASIDLPVAAALNRLDDFRRLLPSAPSEARHLALALASQYGHVDIVSSLLDSGENPNRYNPVGGHSHTTPLHQAAGAGYEGLVHLLVERGARLDQKDILWHATPAGWAQYAGHAEIAQYLRERESPKGKTNQNAAS